MMKKITGILLCLVALIACDKVYINGELDGMWMLQQVDDGQTVIQPENISYSFQRHMTFISEHYEEKMPTRYLGNLFYQGDTVTMSGFRKFLEEHIVATPEKLQEYYLYSDSTIFVIERLDEDMLIMKSGNRRYTLRRW